MSLIKDCKQFIFENKPQLLINIFFLILAYGYFITNWTISIDSEIASFAGYPINCFDEHSCIMGGLRNWFVSVACLKCIQDGRFLMSLIDILSNNTILPFWNDFVSISLIFLSSIIWLTALSKIKTDKYSVFIFSLLFTISPIYVFYLRFTTYNISISVGLLLESLAIYYFVKAISLKGEQIRLNLILSIVYIFLALCIYQMFAIYWVTSILLIVNYIILIKYIHNDQPYIKAAINYISLGILLLVIGLILYGVTSLVIYKFITHSSYTDNFMHWGKQDKVRIYHAVGGYFEDITIKNHFNCVFILSLVGFLISGVYLLYMNSINVFFIIMFTGLVVSPFLLVFGIGWGVPLRTLQPLVLSIAGIWLLMYHIFQSRSISKKIILILVTIATLFNTQSIVKLFYGDNMRFQYDVNYANQIYSSVIAHAGSQIKYKPLVIVGNHSYLPKPFIIKFGYDTLGYSFFEWGGGDYNRMYEFMRWIGNDYIKPSINQQSKGVSQSYNMPSYPDPNSIEVTSDLIIMKLSDN